MGWMGKRNGWGEYGRTDGQSVCGIINVLLPSGTTKIIGC